VKQGNRATSSHPAPPYSTPRSQPSPKASRWRTTRAIFTTPPTPLSAYGDAFMKYLLSFDFEAETAKIYATSAGGSGLIDCCLYTESAWDFMMASSTNRAALRDACVRITIRPDVLLMCTLFACTSGDSSPPPALYS
jgi:hypothetical protein